MTTQMTDKACRVELLTQPHYAQGYDEDGNVYDFQKGWVIVARRPVHRGDAIYTYQKQVFGIDEWEKAEAAIDLLCGSPSNGFWTTIDPDSEDWMLTGASY